MVNSTTVTNLVDSKMRDEVYLRHLREVEKINNREAEKVVRDVRSYNSISNVHQKHKAYAFDWHHREDNNLVEERNQKMAKKIKEIRSYISTQPLNRGENRNKRYLMSESGNPEQGDTSPREREE